MRRIFLLMAALLIGGMGLLAAGTAEAAFSDRAKDMAKITGIRIGRADGNVRVVIDSDRPVVYRQSVLADPTRIVVDVQNAWIVPAFKKRISIDSELVSGVRAAQFDETTVRIVVETSAGKDSYKVFALDGGKPRIVMDFGRTPRPAAAKPPQERTPPVLPPAPPAHTDEEEDTTRDTGDVGHDISAIIGLKGKKIAIDPGHGGSDSGAIGPTGIMEKSVTLRVSRELKRLLEAEGASVVLTRTGDTEVSPKGASATSVEELEARCAVANRAQADIFLSIHADAFTNREVKGTTAYYYTKGTKQSKRLADSVRMALIDAIGTLDRGTQTSNFYVVKHTDMPAILVEISFISNPDEEKMMNSEAGIKKIAQGIADGIADYFG
ncbi:N-acetylmuramoyl-L-alanine amidase [uncultured Selenomonas sp.]|uniref:N-acetylmuramoyl-L-alanine amidase n=1 Tax=uncultured Selenomonas sp. TaxID=159275 RepID=UPI0028D1648C|nr:N-acetylmuramoyl-L-alanine amidase [uncultured Selenomonas sp.]